MDHPPLLTVRPLLEAALREDLGGGDITTRLTVDPAQEGRGAVVAKEEGMVAGLWVAREVFRLLDPAIGFEPLVRDGDGVEPGREVARIRGRLRPILEGERVALNLLQHLSGIATLTHRFCRAVAGLPCRIVDTRKTTPGLRILEKYAVRAGGGHNHRFGLSDAILIKDNHIAACGSVAEAVARCRAGAPHTMTIEVEVARLDQVEEAVRSGAQALLLDNMDTATLRRAVGLAKGLAPGIVLEASGGITLENVREVAETGVDIISVGALTHSAPALDLSLRVE